MPGSSFPPIVDFAFGEKPLGSTKMNVIHRALDALKTWTSAGDILYGHDADQLERIAKPASSGLFTMGNSGVPAWLLGAAGKVPRWNSSGVLAAYPWLSFDEHYDATGHTYSSASWRNMPNSDKTITVNATSTIIVLGAVINYGTGTYGQREMRVQIDGTDDAFISKEYYQISEILTTFVAGMKTGVPAGSKTIRLREYVNASSYTVRSNWYVVLIVPE